MRQMETKETNKRWKKGYVSGSFDMFHIGHLNLIKRAKEHCNHLIVGVTTDEEALNIKRKKPIIPFEERVEIVKSIRFVDNVVPEDNSDKLVAFNRLHFNVIFKGDDWKGTAKWNKYEEEFLKRNVKVIYFPYTDGTSSTLLSKYLQESMHDHTV